MTPDTFGESVAARVRALLPSWVGDETLVAEHRVLDRPVDGRAGRARVHIVALRARVSLSFPVAVAGYLTEQPCPNGPHANQGYGIWETRVGAVMQPVDSDLLAALDEAQAEALVQNTAWALLGCAWHNGLLPPYKPGDRR
jgi:hypothetical protein